MDKKKKKTERTRKLFSNSLTLTLDASVLKVKSIKANGPVVIALK